MASQFIKLPKVSGGGGGGSATWGSITGTLSSQTDLQSALNAKADSSALSSHVSNTSNPHSTTKAQVGLGNVPNVDATDPANIVQSASYRFVTDTEKSTWSGKQNALGFTPENVANKENTTLDTSTTKYPTNNLVKTVTDAISSALSSLTSVVSGKANLSGGNSFSGTQTFGDGVINRFLGDVVNVTSFPYTLQASDNGKILRFNSATPVVVNLPNNLVIGFNIAWSQAGAGQVTFAPASGSTMNNRQSQVKSAGQYAMGSLIVMTNTGGTSAMYNLAGDTGA